MPTTYTVKLTPDVVNRDTEGSLDTAINDAGNSIQRTMNAILIKTTGGEYKMAGNVADGGTFNDTILAVDDAGYFGTFNNIE